MSEAATIRHDAEPVTVASLAGAFRSLGMRSGQVVLVHAAMSRLGWVCGGPQAVLEALIETVGPDGTLVMPTHTAGNTEPSRWSNPPIPEAWWPIVREHMPAFDRQRTPTRAMGAIAELFRCWPETVRSAHPVGSFAARGPAARHITSAHPLDDMFGDGSPLGRLYELDAWILLLGVGHEHNTSLHLAEARGGETVAPWIDEGCAMLVGGERRWVNYRMRRGETDDFPALGLEYETVRGVSVELVGAARTRFLRMRPLVDFAVAWLVRHRAG